MMPSTLRIPPEKKVAAMMPSTLEIPSEKSGCNEAFPSHARGKKWLQGCLPPFVTQDPENPKKLNACALPCPRHLTCRWRRR